MYFKGITLFAISSLMGSCGGGGGGSGGNKGNNNGTCPTSHFNVF